MKRVPARASRQEQQQQQQQPQQSSPLRGALAWLLVLAALFGQGLGAVHSISHGAPGAVGKRHAHAAPPQAQAQTQSQAQAQAQAQAQSLACEHGQGPGLQALFGHAPDEPGCRLFDPLLQAGPLLPAPQVLAVPARTPTPPPPSIGVWLAAPAAAYLARGPPRG